MKQLVKNGLIRLLNPVVTRLGYKRTGNETEPGLLENFFSILTAIKFDPVHIVDVGANHGTWTRTALKYFPLAYYSLLEPQNWLEVHVKDLLERNPKIKFYPVGAGSSTGSFKFTIANRDDSSTFRYNAETAMEQGLNQIDVEVVTLNALIGKQHLPVPDIIKIDAEGLDIEVLKGASDFLGKTEIIMVEAGVAAKGIDNDISGIIGFMEENGYKLFEITDLNRPFDLRILWLVELAFIKKGGFIDLSYATNLQ